MPSDVFPTERPTDAARWRGPEIMRVLAGSRTTAVAYLWIVAALVSVFAPDMVTGSEQEHLPIALFTVWIWASVATGFLLMGSRKSDRVPGLVVGSVALWSAVLVTVLAAPDMVTGTDPTRIPLAVFVAPVVAAVTTGFLALSSASAAR